MRDPKPVIHGGDHLPGGSDPVPGMNIGFGSADLPTIKAMFTSSSVDDDSVVGVDLAGAGLPWDGFLYEKTDPLLFVSDGEVSAGSIDEDAGAGLYLVCASMGFKGGTGSYRSFRVMSNDGIPPVLGVVTLGFDPDIGGYSAIVDPALTKADGRCYTSVARVSNGWTFPAGVRISHDGGSGVHCYLVVSWTLIYHAGLDEPNYAL